MYLHIRCFIKDYFEVVAANASYVSIFGIYFLILAASN